MLYMAYRSCYMCSTRLYWLALVVHGNSNYDCFKCINNKNKLKGGKCFMSELGALILLLKSSVKSEFIIPKELWQPGSYREDRLNEALSELSCNDTLKVAKYYTDTGIKLKVEKIQK